MVQVPRPILPCDVTRCFYTLTVEEIYATLQSSFRKLRGRRKTAAKVPGDRLLAQCCSLARRWNIQSSQRRHSQYGPDSRPPSIYLYILTLAQVLHVHPHSVLFTRKPRSGWVIFHEMEETKKIQ